MASDKEPDFEPADGSADALAPGERPHPADAAGQAGDAAAPEQPDSEGGPTDSPPSPSAADPQPASTPEETTLQGLLLEDPGPAAAVAAARPKWGPVLQVCLLINTALVTIAIVLLLRPSARATSGSESRQSLWPVPKGAPTTAPATAPAAAAAKAVEASSRRLAERAYAAKDYAQALGHYQRLLEFSRAMPGNAVISDFCRLWVARCQSRLGALKEARTLLARVRESHSPILRAMAAQDTAVLEYLSGNYASARVKAYSAIAAVGAVETPLSLETDSDYLLARSLTATVLASHDIRVAIPLRRAQPGPDVFARLPEEGLRSLLEEGRSLADGAVLGPQVKEIGGQRLARRYSAACRRAPLQDLLQRLSVASGMDIRWAVVDQPVRRRAVTLSLRSASAQRICEVACGSAGLLVRFTGDQAVVHNPHACKSLSEQRDLLGSEAVSTWRRFFLRNPGDPRLARGHFALAALHECRWEPNSAIREYQTVASRFPKDAAAGAALLRGARLKIRLENFSGAQRDLLEVLNVYPECEFLDEVNLSLARAYAKGGIHHKAIPIFKKLYHLDRKAASRKGACLGASRSLIAKGDDEQACMWLDRYFKLSRGALGPEAAGAYLMMGRCKARLGKLAEASTAFVRALRARPSNSQRSEIVLRLAIILKDRGRYVQAIRTLSKVDPKTLRPRQRTDFLLTEARTYQAMGLADKALAMLRREVATTRDEEAALGMSLEMARCTMELGDPGAARRMLVELVPKMKPGAAMTAATCDLAESCLADGKTAQAIAIGEGLLRFAGADALPRVRDILGRALAREGKHERAALAFAGPAAKKTGGPKE